MYNTATYNKSDSSGLAQSHTAEEMLLKSKLKRLAIESKAFYSLSFLASLLVVVSFWGKVSTSVLIGWLAIQCALPLGQLTFYAFIAGNKKVSLNIKSYAVTLGSALSGLAWSLMIFLLEPLNPSEQALLYTLVASLSVYSTAALSAHLPAFFAFAGGALFMPYWHLIATYNLDDPTLPSVVVLFSVFLFYSAIRINRSTVLALNYRGDKDALIANLTHSMTQTDLLNQELVQEVQQRVTAELELKSAHEQLEATVEARTHELLTSNELLEQEMAQHKHTTRELMESQNRLSKSMEVSKLGLWEWDLINDCVYHSHFHSLFGSSNTTVNQYMKHLKAHMHKDDFKATKKALFSHMRGKSEQYLVRYRLQQEDGAWLWFEDSGKAIEWSDKGYAAKIIGTRRDVTLEMKHTERLKLGSIVFQNITEAIAILDSEFRFMMVNDNFVTMTGFNTEEVIGARTIEFGDSPEKRETLKSIGHELQHQDFWQGEITNYRKSGSAYPMWLKVNVVRDASGHVSHYICLLSDLTARKEVDRKLRYLTYYDALTGLVNRELFLNRLHDGLQNSYREETSLAVFLINLDRFKLINDTFGHAAGDRVLKTTAERLSSIFGQADTVARYSSDEFAISLSTIGEIRDVEAQAKQAISVLNRPIQIEGKDLILSASIGISVSPEHSKDMHILMNKAELARNQAKAMGGNVFYLYQEHLTDSSAERLHLENELRTAMQENQFEVFYQPKQNLRDNTIESAEALIRWNHPLHGLISPAKFIPLAEETGLINQIGEFVLRTACTEACHWKESNGRPLKISVNLSAQQLKKVGFINKLDQILQETGLPPERLTLEITESLLMDDVEETIKKLKQIRALKVGLSIDDFGTGYSSLSYLKQFPIDILKIDQSFIRDINTNADDAAITKAIIAMAHSLDLRVIAEGVETEESRQFLKDQNCDAIQGFLVSKPLTKRQISDMLNTKTG